MQAHTSLPLPLPQRPSAPSQPPQETSTATPYTLADAQCQEDWPHEQPLPQGQRGDGVRTKLQAAHEVRAPQAGSPSRSLDVSWRAARPPRTAHKPTSRPRPAGPNAAIPTPRLAALHLRAPLRAPLQRRDQFVAQPQQGGQRRVHRRLPGVPHGRQGAGRGGAQGARTA